MAGSDATITGRQRIAAAYKGGYADMVPAYPIAGSFAGCLEGLSIEEYCTNPAKATRATELLRAVSTSCELPPRANPDCVRWFMAAAREYDRYDRIFGAAGPPAAAAG